MAVTNYEKLLQSISDGTPSEVYPVTREEQYLAYIAGESATYPDSPITRREMYLEQIAENGTGGGGSAKPSQTKTVEITENGTYSITPDLGYTLSRVTANVTVETGGGTEQTNKFSQMVDKSITEVTEEDLKGATQIGYCAFHSCFNLSSITIPETVTYIASGAFAFCDALTQLTIPSSVTSIGAGALDFAALQNRTIRMLPDEPPSIPSDFTSVMYPKTYIVNKGRGDVYKSATNWADLAERIVEVEE